MRPTRFLALSFAVAVSFAPRLARAQDADAGAPAADAEVQAPPTPSVAAPGAPADDAPLSAFVTQRAAIVASAGGMQRGLAMGGAMPLVEGVADFLVQRAEAEVEAYASTALAHQVCTPETLLPLLPSTCAILAGWQEGDAVGSGRARTDALVAALRADLRALPADLLRLILSRVPPEVGEGMRLFFALTAELVDAILAHASPEELTDRLFRVALACDVRAQGDAVMLECATPEGKTWQRDLLRVANLARLALTGGVTDTAVLGALGLDASRPELLAVRSMAQRLVDDARALQQAVRDARDSEGDDAHVRTLARSLTARMVSLAIDGVALVRMAESRGATTDRAREDVLVSLRDGVNASLEGNPTAALAATIRLGTALSTMVHLDVPALRGIRVPPGVLTALTTAVALADAKDKDAVRAILEQVAAPVGSWRAKRRGFVVSVTGLVGFGGLYDMLAVDGHVAGGASTLGVALHASVGLDLNLVGHRDFGTFGFYLTAIDLGSIASAPFGLDVTKIVPGGTQRVQVDVDPVSLFSPGVWVRWGIGDTPIVLAAGGTWVPHARRLETTDAMGVRTEQTVDAMRFELVVAIDTTLWVL